LAGHRQKLKHLADVVESLHHQRAQQVKGRADAYTTGAMGTFPSGTVKAWRRSVDALATLHQHLHDRCGPALASALDLYALTTLHIEHTFSVMRVKGNDTHRDLLAYLTARAAVIVEELKERTQSAYPRPQTVHRRVYYKNAAVSQVPFAVVVRMLTSLPAQLR